MEMNSAYTAATTAASVGVNTPNFRPTTTISGRTSAKVASFREDRTSWRLARLAGAMLSLRMSTHQVTQRDAASRMPGKMPAMKSLEIDTLAATPNTTKPMLGGMMGAMMLAEASRPAERALSWPACTIIGSSRAESAAASATADPESAAMKTAAMMPT
ncbi:hypothetical protein FQZ97_1113150 [compost metagenome]